MPVLLGFNNATPNNPSPGDVRDGVQFGPANIGLGTLVLPAADKILSGTAYDTDGATSGALVIADPAVITGAVAIAPQIIL